MNKSIIKIIIKLAELSFGVICGLLVYKLSSNDPQAIYNGLFGIIAGLLASMILSFFIENNMTRKKVDEVKTDLLKIEKVLLDAGNYKRTLAKFISENPVIIEAQDIQELWLELLWEIEESFWAITYLNPKDTWDKKYTSKGNYIQQAKIKAKDVTIKRVFVFDKADEFENIDEHIQKQTSLGIETRCIIKKDLKEHWREYLKTNKIPPLDFAIIDGKYIIIVYLDKSRAMKKAELHKITKKNDFFINLFTTAFDEANECDAASFSSETKEQIVQQSLR